MPHDADHPSGTDEQPSADIEKRLDSEEWAQHEPAAPDDEPDDEHDNVSEPVDPTSD